MKALSQQLVALEETVKHSLANMDARLEAMDARFERMEDAMKHSLANTDARMDARLEAMDARMESWLKRFAIMFVVVVVLLNYLPQFWLLVRSAVNSWQSGGV